MIPVLVDGATMPARSELPPALASLASRQAMTIHHESFSSDVNRLIGAIERRLGTTVIPSDQPVAAPVPAVDPAVVQADYTAALAAFFAHRWAEAVDGFERVLRQQPEHGGARDRLVEARRHLQLETWNSQADHAAGEGRWADTVVLLENIRSLDPNYPDLTRRLQAATAKRRVADLQADIRNLAAAGQWSRGDRGGPGAGGDRPVAGRPRRAGQPGPRETGRAGPARPAATPHRRTPGRPAAPGPAHPADDGPTAGRRWWLRTAGVAQGFAAPPPKRKRSTTGWWPPWRSRSWSPSSSGSSVYQGGGRGTATGQPSVSTEPSTAPSGPEGSSPPASTPPVSTPPPSASATLDTSELRTHIPSDIRPTCAEYAPPAGERWRSNWSARCAAS